LFHEPNHVVLLLMSCTSNIHLHIPLLPFFWRIRTPFVFKLPPTTFLVPCAHELPPKTSMCHTAILHRLGIILATVMSLVVLPHESNLYIMHFNSSHGISSSMALCASHWNYFLQKTSNLGRGYIAFIIFPSKLWPKLSPCSNSIPIFSPPWVITHTSTSSSFFFIPAQLCSYHVVVYLLFPLF